MDYFNDEFQIPDGTNNVPAGSKNPTDNNVQNATNYTYDYNGADVKIDPNVNPTKEEKDPYAVPEGCCKKTFSWNFYRQFCDMTSKEVGCRMLQALAFWKGSFLEDAAMKKPDLWGPFWLSTFLVFCLYFIRSVAIAINNVIIPSEEPPKEFGWADFGIYAGCIYAYIIVVPLVIFLICWCLHYDLSYPVVSCLFGYAMIDFTPVVICICIDAFISEGTVLIASAVVYTICLAWSALFIIINLVKYLKHLRVNKAPFAAVLVVSIVFHLGIFITVGYFYLTKKI